MSAEIKRSDYATVKEYQKDYQKFSPKAKAARKRYYERNKEHRHLLVRNFRKTDWGRLKQIYSKCYAQAARDLCPMEIGTDFIGAYPKTCPILGIPLSLEDPRSYNFPAIIQIIPGLGFTEKNCRIISSRAKHLLSNGTQEEFEKISLYKSNSSTT